MYFIFFIYKEEEMKNFILNHRKKIIIFAFAFIFIALILFTFKNCQQKKDDNMADHVIEQIDNFINLN